MREVTAIFQQQSLSKSVDNISKQDNNQISEKKRKREERISDA
jgi:hypothetical protein